MSRLITLIVFIIILSIAPFVHAQIISTFDGTDEEGWMVEGNDEEHTLTGTDVTTGGSKRNPGGYLEVTDVENDWLFAVAPEKFHTDWSPFPYVSADIKGDSAGIEHSVAFFIFSGSEKWVHVFDANQVEAGEWTQPLLATLDEPNWTRLTGTGPQNFNSVISNVTDFKIRIDLNDNNVVGGTAEINGIDNVAVAPEPISSILFVVGGATLGFRRFRKKFKN